MVDDYWVALGWYFGYPECCIQAFLNPEHRQRYKMSNKFSRQLYGTGYVVCDRCNELKDARELLNYIAAHRHPKAEPFPKQGKVLRYMDEILLEFQLAHQEESDASSG
jgi:hypothetical protein